MAHSHAGPNLTSFPSGKVGHISSAQCSNGWRGGGDGHARDALVGGRAAASRMPRARTLALPPRWPTGKVLADGPNSGDRPSLESRPFFLSRISSAATCCVHSSHPPHTGNGRFLHRPQKMSHSTVLGPARCALSIVKWVRRWRLGFRPGPPSADRSGIAEREVGATSLAPRTALPDFRGPVCDALRAVNLYGISKLR